MSGDFATPPGNPAGLRTAANSLMHAAADLDSQNTATKNAVATAISQWRAPRCDDFRHAGAGLQAELTGATTAVERVAALITAYAQALERTQQEIATLAQQDAASQEDATAQSRRLNADDPQTDRIFQHAAQRHAQLVAQADAARSDLNTLAGRIAAQIDAETDTAVPKSASLSPAQLARQVDAAMGVDGLAGAAGQGTLTLDQSWSALAPARRAVPGDAVEGDGEVDWNKAIAEFNDTYVGPPASAGAMGVAPSEGWAIYRLLQTQRDVAADSVALRTAFSEIVGPVAYDLDLGLASLGDLNDALIRFRNGADAVDTFNAARSAEALDAAKAGGLPEAGAVGALGKLAAGVGVLGDVMTLINPGVENTTEGTTLRVAAGANIVGTGAVLLAANAAADWIPVAGQIVMVGTGLFLAGDYVYHHWDQIKNFVTDTAPRAIASAAKWTGNALATGAKAVGHFFSSLF